MNAMNAFGRKNSHLIFPTAIILLYLIKSLKSDPEFKKGAIGLAINTSNRSSEVVLYLIFLPIANILNYRHDNVKTVNQLVPPKIDPQIMPTLQPLVELYRTRILNSINKCRDLHGVPNVVADPKGPKAVDYIAAKIFRKEGIESIYIPSENEKYIPVGYFPLVSRMEVPKMNDYANELKYNPIYQWYSHRNLYKGYYDKDKLPKYGFYTQLIWKNSQQVGIGMAYKRLDNGNHEVVIFLSFTPQGNIPDTNEFQQNVLPRLRDVPSEIESPTHVVPLRTDILSLINEVRELHNVPKVTIDIGESNKADHDASEVLQGKIKDYAEFYIPGKTKEPDDYFELNSRMTVPDMNLWLKELQYNPIFQWYACRKYYPGFYDKKLHPNYGFYTQLIWKNSKKVIIGGAFRQLPNQMYEVVLLLDFWPHGNVPGEFLENVLPPQYEIPHTVDPNDVPILNPLNSHLKGMIFNSINRVRGLYDASRVDYNITYSNTLDTFAQAVLDGTDKKTFVPGLNEDNLPEGYFPLVHKMVIPELSNYARERQYNPVYLWFHNRFQCLYRYDKAKHPKCGKCPTLKPDLAEYKKRILNSINTVRRLHGVPKLIVNIPYSNYADVTADGILLKLNGSVTMYIPLENDKNPPTSYFPLVNRMTVPNINAYARERQHNPIFQWYATRKHYAGYYTENTFLKYGFFTQLIWRNTINVAIGIAHSVNDERTYDVVTFVEFYPHGNTDFPESWSNNVFNAKHTIPADMIPDKID